MWPAVPLICLVLFGTTFGDELKTPFGLFDRIQTSINQGLDIPKNAVKLGTGLSKNAVQYGTDIGKMGLAAGTSLSSQALGEGIDLGKQSLDLFGSISGMVPGANVPASIATSIGKWGLNLGNQLGQQGIKATSDIGNTALDYTNKMAKLTTGTIDNFSSAGFGLTKDAIQGGLNSFKNMYNSGMDALSS